MKFGIQVFFQHGDLSMTQREMYQQEIDLCLRAEDLGLDYILSPEHHSTDYSIAPDPMSEIGMMRSSGALTARRSVKDVTDAFR